MKYAHFIKIRVFVKDFDTPQTLKDVLKQLLNLNSEQEKIKIQSKTAYGFEDKKISIYTLSLTKERHTTSFIKSLMNNLSKDQKEVLLNQMESRLDDKLHFYIRLDKNDLVNNIYTLTDHGNCFHIKISVAAFPHKREYAIKTIKKIINLD